MKVFIILLLAVCFLFYCSNSPTSSYTPTAKGLTKSGWRYFEDKDYEKSLKKFKKANGTDNTYMPAYSGLVWSYLMLDSLNNGLGYIDLSTNLTTDSTDLKVELAAGSIMTYALSDSFSNVITLFTENADNWTDFVFSHYSKMDEDDIRWAAALAYFHSGDYKSSAEQIQMIYPTWDYNPYASDLPREILKKLEFFSQGG